MNAVAPFWWVLQVGARAAACLIEAAEQNPTGNVLAVTHSTVIESLLATCFAADFESIHTENLSWVRLRVADDKLSIDAFDGVSFSQSPDALYSDSRSCRLFSLTPGRSLLLGTDADDASRNERGPLRGSQTVPSSLSSLGFMIVSAFVFASLGVVQIVRTGGEIGGRQVEGEATRVGRWGAVTATVDWCERNYFVTEHVAELWNSLSSLFIVAAGVGAAVQAVRVGAETRYVLIGAILAVVGLGSVAFHATLRQQDQSLDEIPMLWVAVLGAYIGYHAHDPKNKG